MMDPTLHGFHRLDHQFPGAQNVVVYARGAPSISSAPLMLRLNVYLTKDGEYVTIWFGLLDLVIAAALLDPGDYMDIPAISLVEQYHEYLFNGYISSDEQADAILGALRLERFTPQRLTVGAAGKLEVSCQHEAGD
jgi:hypothetical protein